MKPSRVVAAAGAGWLIAGLGAGLGGGFGTAAAEPTGQGFALGPFRAYPWLNFLFGYSDNYYRSNDKLERLGLLPVESALESIVEPGIRLTTVRGADAYNLSYLARIGTVSTDADDDFVDQRAGANANWELGLRHRLSLDYQFWLWHDPPGTGDPTLSSRPNFFDSPDRWQQNQVMLEYSYGAPGARGRVDLRGGGYFRRYLNNDQEYRDSNQSLLGATFYARVRPKLSLLFDVDWQDYRYTRDQPGLTASDSDQWRVFGGATWDATAKTSGTVKLGWMTQDFSSGDYASYDNFAWEVDLQWRPRTYSTVNLGTSRTAYESPESLAGSTVVSAVDIDWIHYWKPFLHTKLGVLATDDDYNGTPRNDNRYGASGGVFYQARPWLELGAEYRYETRVSNEPLAEYDENQLLFSVRTAY